MDTVKVKAHSTHCTHNTHTSCWWRDRSSASLTSVASSWSLRTHCVPRLLSPSIPPSVPSSFPLSRTPSSLCKHESTYERGRHTQTQIERGIHTGENYKCLEAPSLALHKRLPRRRPLPHQNQQPALQVLSLCVPTQVRESSVIRIQDSGFRVWVQDLWSCLVTCKSMLHTPATRVCYTLARHPSHASHASHA